ncbi:MAG TPA: hypothetical protein DDW32_02515 [Thermotoga sp.]|uniref:Uncharacterized protein n=1 Tax=Thermotoga maritima (strain ATCC 43589 / DSM 3109 / JCM 10099 / NBRC 100826 / MSB8) TaxID=243274 RepID=Q9WXQ3_THEMA|nr:hypothetical protein TM_0046 [Thermotoga maritima MSB8]AKE25993.1 hypothetical protein THMC_0042 [Thermotoga maritima]HAA82637.1 hypothetical protein [Thermotoga petrophila]HBF69400.1 hypothetical protein [Thermotoga sp.]AGL48969.1 hypothetical protein Tmari_0043 [Thermotoga maritima MSB8]
MEGSLRAAKNPIPFRGLGVSKEPYRMVKTGEKSTCQGVL